MQSSVTEIAPDVFRISTFNPAYGIEFNQFLVRDDEPFLMHTGLRRMFDVTLQGVASVIDPATLRWIGYSHFEPDECGALNEFQRAAPQSRAVCGAVGAMVMLSDYSDREPQVLDDGGVLETGRHRLRFLASPHLPHGWDAGLFFEETDRTLFCSDLFFQPGETPPLTASSLTEQVRDIIRGGLTGPLAHDLPYTPRTPGAMARLAALAPKTLAVMHGSSFSGDGGRAIEELSQVMSELLAVPDEPPAAR
jgi:flavorubredoxin